MSFETSLYCRLCAARKPFNEIMDLSSNVSIQNEIIDKLAIFSVDTVDFTDQTLPKTVCTTCQNNVRVSYVFFKKIQESQLLLKELKNNAFSSCLPSFSETSCVKIEIEYTEVKEETFSDSFDNDTSHFVECMNEVKTEPLIENAGDASHDIHEDGSLPSIQADHTTSNTKPEMREDDRYQCTACGKNFSSWNELQQHTSTDKDHIPKKRTKATIEDLTCDICSKVFPIPAKLRYHKLKHTDSRSRDYVCDVCGKAFYAKDSLNTHKIIHNPETQDCKICKKTFISLIRLKKHLKTHDMTKPFECNECHRRFRMKYQLGKHMVVHSNVFPYSCDFCKKGFRFKNVLKTHENQHTGAKPFVCTVCGMDFTNWSNCNKHMVRKHGVSLAKRVKTAHGMMPLNQDTLKPKEVDLESVKWSEQMCMPKKKGRKKKQENNM